MSPSVTLYRCVLAEGLPLTPELVSSARLTGSRDPPGSHAPPLSVYRHMLLHPASVGAGIQTRVLGLAQPPLYQLGQLHSLDFTLFLRQHLNDLSLLESNPQITAIFFCFSLPSDGVVGACHIPHHQTSLLQMFSSGSWHGNW